MKYTRYDYRKKNKEFQNLTIVLVSVLIIAFLLGTGIYSILLKPNDFGKDSSNNHTQNIKVNDTDKDKDNDKQEVNNIKFVAIQGGFFKNKDNAEVVKNSLRNYVIPFTITEGDSIRVIAGVFSEEDSAKVIETLNQNGIENTKTIFEVNKNDLCDGQIAEMVNGNIKILTKLTEKDVTGYGTDDFKNWISTSIQKVDEKSKNYNSFEEYKNYINGFPNVIGKDKVEENYINIYNILKKITAK